MNILIVGASSGIGNAILYELAAIEQSIHILVAGRDVKTLKAIKNDIEIIYQSVKVDICFLDLMIDQSINELILKNSEFLSDLNKIFVTAGKSIDNDNGVNQIKEIDSIIKINYTSICLLLQKLVKLNPPKLQSISVISSVAAHGERSINMIYSSAKAGLEKYLLGLRMFLARKEVNVNIIALGYADTRLARGKKLLLPVASSKKVANFIVRTSKKNKGLIFYPLYWRLIILILKLIPFKIKTNLKF